MSGFEPGTREDGRSKDGRHASGPERLMRPYFEDPDLRGVLFAAIGVLVTFGVWIGANAIRSRSLIAIGVLLLLGVGSAELIRSELRGLKRPGPISGIIATLWLLTGLGIWGALHSNFI
jgi:hypothetical protein